MAPEVQTKCRESPHDFDSWKAVDYWSLGLTSYAILMGGSYHDLLFATVNPEMFAAADEAARTANVTHVLTHHDFADVWALYRTTVSWTLEDIGEAKDLMDLIQALLDRRHPERREAAALAFLHQSKLDLLLRHDDDAAEQDDEQQQRKPDPGKPL